MADEFHRWRSETDPAWPDGAESYESAVARARSFFDDVRDLPGTTLAATHGSLARVLVTAVILGHRPRPSPADVARPLPLRRRRARRVAAPAHGAQRRGAQHWGLTPLLHSGWASSRGPPYYPPGMRRGIVVITLVFAALALPTPAFASLSIGSAGPGRPRRFRRS